MKHTSHHQKNGHYAGKKDAVYMDLRVPFAVCASVGLVLLGACAAVGRLNVPSLPLGWFGIGALSVFAVTCAVLFLIYLLRYLRLREAIAASEQISTDVYDMFRYVIDVPYAVIGKDGVVKIINSALQDVLGYHSPVCNIRLSEFCAIPIDIIAVSAHGARTGAHVSDLLPDGPVTRLGNGKRYELQSYPMQIDGE